MENSVKQSITGFKVTSISVKKKKDTESVQLLLSAEVGDIGAGEYDMGDVLKALVSYQTSENEVGLNLLVTK